VKIAFDENLSPKLAYAFASLFSESHEVIHLRQRFGQGITDLEWIPQLSQEGRWTVISGDRKITKNKSHYYAFRNSNLIGFFLYHDLYKAPVVKQMERLLVLWDKIELQANIMGGGAMFLIRKSSTRLDPLK
jgi:hypothetical protein